MRNRILKLTLMTASLCLSQIVLAKPSPGSESHEQSMERIEVTGQLPASYYRKMLYQAEDEFFAMFNALTDKPEFKVTCERKNQHSFSRLKERVCEANFVAMINAGKIESTKRMQSSRGDLVSNNLSARKQYQQMAQQQAEYMVELINSNGKLREEYLKLAAAKQKFQQAKSGE